jgi:hypothetical protein
LNCALLNPGVCPIFFVTGYHKLKKTTIFTCVKLAHILNTQFAFFFGYTARNLQTLRFQLHALNLKVSVMHLAFAFFPCTHCSFIHILMLTITFTNVLCVGRGTPRSIFFLTQKSATCLKNVHQNSTKGQAGFSGFFVRFYNFFSM